MKFAIVKASPGFLPEIALAYTITTTIIASSEFPKAVTEREYFSRQLNMQLTFS